MKFLVVASLSLFVLFLSSNLVSTIHNSRSNSQKHKKKKKGIIFGSGYNDDLPENDFHSGTYQSLPAAKKLKK